MGKTCFLIACILTIIAACNSNQPYVYPTPIERPTEQPTPITFTIRYEVNGRTSYPAEILYVNDQGDSEDPGTSINRNYKDGCFTVSFEKTYIMKPGSLVYISAKGSWDGVAECKIFVDGALIWYDISEGKRELVCSGNVGIE